MKKKYKIKLLLFLVLSSLLILFLVFLFLLKLNFRIYLVGDSILNIPVYSEYQEEGVKSTLFGVNVDLIVDVKTDLNTNILGSYKIQYNTQYLGIKKRVKRVINVVDMENPQIILNGEEIINLSIGDQYQENGAVANDNYDGDLTDNIQIDENINIEVEGEYKVVYTVQDSSGNISSIERKVIVNKKTNNATKVKEVNKETVLTTSEQVDLSNPMVKYIVENNYDISFGYYNLVTGDSYFYHPDQIYFAASLIKVPEALYLYDHDMVNDSTKEYIKKIITKSDNPSHHYLQNLIGQNNLKQYGASLGAKYTLAGGGSGGNTTVNDQMVFLKRLYEITKDGQNEELKSWFINGYGNHLHLDITM